MKRKQAVSALWGTGLAFLLSLSSVACFATAFDMTVDLGAVAWCCLAASVVAGVCYTLKLGLLPLGAGAVLLGYLWQAENLLSNIKALGISVLQQYYSAYGWTFLEWSSKITPTEQPTLTLCVLAVIIALSVAWTICRKKSALPAFLISFLPFALCLVVTDRVPKMPWLYFLFLGLVMLVLTHSARRQDETQGNRLSAMLALPVALSLLIMFAANPQDRYTGHYAAQDMVDAIMNMEPVRTIVSYFTESGTTGTDNDGRSVNLKNVGYRITNYAEILRIRSNLNGVVYLRARALDTYDGVSWTDSGISTGDLEWPRQTSNEPKYEVVISTRYAHQMLYLPYNTVSRDLQYMTVGLTNDKKLSQYSFSFQPVADEEYFALLYPNENSWRFADAEKMKSYTHLSDSVLQWAEPLAAELTEGMVSYYHKAQAIGDYVRASASYNTYTQRMPSGENDFAKWFLEQSDTGYCVHFATSAAVLLQAAGIPARYVTGYVADLRSGTTKVVQSDDSHAWVEYWLPGYGWTILEATPAEGEAEPTQPTEQTTEPTETEPTTQTQDETEPAATESRPDTPTKKPVKQKIDMTALWVVLSVLAVIAVFVLQRRLRLHLRKKRLRRGDTNRQALTRWQEVTRLSAILKQRPDAELLELAMMAKFSHHTLTA